MDFKIFGGVNVFGIFSFVTQILANPSLQKIQGVSKQILSKRKHLTFFGT